MDGWLYIEYTLGLSPALVTSPVPMRHNFSLINTPGLRKTLTSLSASFLSPFLGFETPTMLTCQFSHL
jgi:hypothetical protein